MRAGIALIFTMLFGGVPVHVLAQTTTQQARDQGKAFGMTAGQGASAIADVEANASNNIPNYNGGNAPEAAMANNPAALEAAAITAGRTNEASVLVINGDSIRPKVPKNLVDETVARGDIINLAPETYVRGVDPQGTTGTCVALPPSTSSPGNFEATCNAGQKLVHDVRSCQVGLRHNFSEVHRYQCTTMTVGGLLVGSGCSAFQAPTCSVSLTRSRLIPFGLFSRRLTYDEYDVTCTAPVSGVVFGNSITAGGVVYEPTFTNLGPVKTYIGSTRDMAQCAGLEVTAGCVAETPEPCSDATPVTRVIDGVSITQSCWAWQRNYQCSTIGTGNDCSALNANPACKFDRVECLDDPQQGACKVEERIYICPIPGNAPGLPQSVCGGDVYCIGGECEAVTREASDEFKDAVVGLNTLDETAKQFDEVDYKLFKGTAETCSKPVFGLANCCGGNGIPLIGACSAEDRMLAVKIDKGTTHLVGTYCSDSFLGVCTAKARTYCSFLSKLTRILQEQGRVQLSKSWGAPQRADCSGFTIDEFASLDLSKMDFAEIYSEFMNAAKLPDEAAAMVSIQTKIADYYSRGGPK